MPEVREWISMMRNRPRILVEPFAGGASVALAMAWEQIVDRVVINELDDDVAAVWAIIFGSSTPDLDALCGRILGFEMSEKTVLDVLHADAANLVDVAFRTILRNRVQRSGIMAPGSGLVRMGEAGRGLRSRWYPATLVARITAIASMRHRVRFIHGDGLDLIRRMINDTSAAFFIDPPYSLAGKRAGARLYTHHAVDHPTLFALAEQAAGSVMMTYDDNPEVAALATRHRFVSYPIMMKTAHHRSMNELILVSGEAFHQTQTTSLGTLV